MPTTDPERRRALADESDRRNPNPDSTDVERPHPPGQPAGLAARPDRAAARAGRPAAAGARCSRTGRRPSPFAGADGARALGSTATLVPVAPAGRLAARRPAEHRRAEAAGRAEHPPVREGPARQQRAADRRARHRQVLADQGLPERVPRRGTAPDRGRQGRPGRPAGAGGPGRRSVPSASSSIATTCPSSRARAATRR